MRPLAPSGAAPEDLEIDTAINRYNVRLNDKDVAFSESLFGLDGSGANISIHYVADLCDVTVGGPGLVDAIHHFEFGGAAFTENDALTGTAAPT